MKSICWCITRASCTTTIVKSAQLTLPHARASYRLYTSSAGQDAPQLQHAVERLISSEQRFGIESPHDWLKLPLRTVEEALKVSLRDGRLKQVLKSAYPAHNWKQYSSSYPPWHPGERWLVKIVTQLFGSSEEIHIHARKETGPGLVNPSTGANLELDIWVCQFHHKQSTTSSLVHSIKLTSHRYQVSTLVLSIRMIHIMKVTRIPPLVIYWRTYKKGIL